MTLPERSVGTRPGRAATSVAARLTSVVRPTPPVLFSHRMGTDARVPQDLGRPMRSCGEHPGGLRLSESPRVPDRREAPYFLQVVDQDEAFSAELPGFVEKIKTISLARRSESISTPFTASAPSVTWRPTRPTRRCARPARLTRIRSSGPSRSSSSSTRRRSCWPEGPSLSEPAPAGERARHRIVASSARGLA